MAGLARILDENSTLRTKLAEQEAARAKDALERARLVSQAHQVEAERDAARAERDAAEHSPPGKQGCRLFCNPPLRPG